MSEITQHEPAPIPNGERPIYEYLIDLIRQRAEAGSKKYGTHLQAHNGRDALMDALQESIDLNQYLCQMVVETTADRDSAEAATKEAQRLMSLSNLEVTKMAALLKDAVEVLESQRCRQCGNSGVTFRRVYDAASESDERLEKCTACAPVRAFLDRPDVKAMGGGK